MSFCCIGATFDGFDCIFTSGFSISAINFGWPDAELVTRSQNVEISRSICNVINKPLICDIDTAYGNAASAVHAVHEFERAGVAGVIIEDQISPKLCPISVAKTNSLVSIEEAAGKIRAVVENKLNPDTVIIARSDEEDFDTMIERGLAYKAAGADVVQLSYIGYDTKEGSKRAGELIDLPQSIVVCGKIDEWPREDIEYMEPKLIQYPLVPIQAMFQAVHDACAYVAQTKQVLGMPVKSCPHTDIVDLVNMQEVERLMAEYGAKQ